MSDLIRPSPQATRLPPPMNRRLNRMRFLSRLLDNSIALPGGYRIGLDPIIGLIPGVGDAIAATLSVWLIYDAACLGVSTRVLMRMTLNVLLETVVGAVPVLGDVMDAVWKANARNMNLVEAEYHPAMKARSMTGILVTIFLVLLAVWAVLFGAIYLVVSAFLALFRFGA